MKNKIYIISLVLLSILYACKDEYEAPNFFSDASWLISETTNVRIKEGVFHINAGHWISFADLSQGTLSHTWTIDEGTQFMNTGFGKDEEDYSTFVIPNSGTVTEDAKAHVYFGESGPKKVHLYNTFRDSVSFTTTGETIDNVFFEGDTLSSYKKDDVWVIDTTFAVNVYGAVKPSLSVYHLIEDDLGTILDSILLIKVEEGELFTEEDMNGVEPVIIGMGDKLHFVDETEIGWPDSIVWTIEAGDDFIVKSSNRDAVISFNDLNFASTISIGMLQTYRTAFDDILPAEAETLIPLKIKVGPSSKPFRIDSDIMDIADETTLSFYVNGNISSIGNMVQDAFTVSVKNDASGFDQNIAVSEVMIDPDNEAKLLLTLEQQIYNSDIIAVSFDSNNEDAKSIKRIDGVNMDAFINKTVTPYFYNINVFTKNNGFEIEAASANVKNGGAEYYWDGKNAGAKIGWTRTTEQSAEGDYSMKFSLAMSEARTLANSKAFDDVTPVGTYFVSFKLFIPEGSTITKLSHVVATTPKAEIVLTDLATYPKGEWITIEQEVEAATSLKGKKLSYFVPYDNTVSGVQTFYIDDCKWIYTENR